MEFKKTKNGKRVYSLEFKQKIIARLNAGEQATDIAREYDIPAQNLHKWKYLANKGQAKALKSNEDVVPAAEYRKLVQELKQARQALGKAVVENEILKEGVDIARKKKWL